MPPNMVEPATNSSTDLTGQDKLTTNVLASWATHFVFVAAGFIMPRVIDGHIGQEALGIWDFGWSLVNSLGLVSCGIMSAISRFVARHRAARDTQALSATISTGLLLYVLCAVVVAVLVLVASILVPMLSTERIGQHAGEAQAIILLLGLTTVIQFAFAVFRGVITGCHRWGAHNAITASAHLITVAGMIVALVAGGGLLALASITVAGECLASVMRVRVARTSCPELRIAISGISWTQARTLIQFGLKSMLGTASQVIMYQANNILILVFLGAPLLAVYARPMALIRHARVLVSKFAFVLTPTASALQAGQDTLGLRNLWLRGTRYGLFLCLPMVAVMAIWGGPLLRLWMGPAYEQGVVLAILAIGHLGSLAQEPSYQVLVGMGRHGLPGVVRLLCAALVLPFSFITLNYLEWGLIGAALAVVLPLTLIDSIFLSVYACRTFALRYDKFLVKVATMPLLVNLPLCIWLAVVRSAMPEATGLALVLGPAVGLCALGIVYWFYIIPTSLRVKLSDFLKKKPAIDALTKPRAT